MSYLFVIFGFLYKLFNFSAKYPQSHQILQQHSPEILSAFSVHMCHGIITYKGRETIMTAVIEQILCKGRNFEHSHGAVHGSKLETLFNLFSTWNLVVKQYQADFKKLVSVV